MAQHAAGDGWCGLCEKWQCVPGVVARDELARLRARGVVTEEEMRRLLAEAVAAKEQMSR